MLCDLCWYFLSAVMEKHIKYYLDQQNAQIFELNVSNPVV